MRKRAALTITAAAVAVIVGLFRWNRGQESRSVETLGPGLTLATVRTTAPTGPQRFHLLRIDTGAGWRVRPESAGETLLSRAPVSEMAVRRKAVAGVNGGYFAENGAPVGALRLQNDWLRLPWNNRTAIGFRPDGKVKIGPLTSRAWMESDDGTRLALDQLNGSPPPNGATLLTSRFGSAYTLHGDESALPIRHGRASSLSASGRVEIPGDGSVLIARGTSVNELLRIPVSSSLRLRVAPIPADCSGYPSVLGAGPRLIENGRITVTSTQEGFRPDVLRRTSRTGIGLSREGELLILTCEGESGETPGVTLDEMAELFLKEGAVEAMNLDGGPSVTLWAGGRLRYPSGGETPVSNSLLVFKDSGGDR